MDTFHWRLTFWCYRYKNCAWVFWFYSDSIWQAGWFVMVCWCLLYMFVIVCLIYINIYLYDYLSIAHHFHFAQKLAWPRGRVRWLQHPAVSLSTILMSMMLVISKQKHDEEPASQAEKIIHQFSGTGVQLCAVPLDPLGYFCYKIRNASVPHNQKIIAVTWSKKWS